MADLVNELDDVRQKNEQIGRILAAPVVRASTTFDFGDGEHQRFKIEPEFIVPAINIVQRQLQQRFQQIEADLKALGFVDDEAPAP
jgi:hypothetical protein